MNKQEINYQIFKTLLSSPNQTQRQMAQKTGLSLGKFNYCLKALVKKGFIKVERFTTSSNKAAYMYLLTPSGIEAKSKITASFLKYKMAEFEEIKQQIEELEQEVATVKS